MAEIIMIQKQKRVRCSNKEFLTAVYSSKTYAEIAEKTGQKLSSTIARYSRTKKLLSEQGVDIPNIEQPRISKSRNKVDDMIEIVKKLKEHHKGV